MTDIMIAVVALIGLAAGVIITIVVMSNANQIHEHEEHEPIGDMVDVKDLMRRWEND